jgi:hypothetical protein
LKLVKAVSRRGQNKKNPPQGFPATEILEGGGVTNSFNDDLITAR